jgi:hypothetical protein
MATNNPAGGAAAAAPPVDLTVRRDTLGWVVVIIGGGGVIALSLVLIFIFRDQQVAEKVFAAVVPLFGTWVGTVLAYYFSRENFEAANASMTRVVRSLTSEDRLRETSVQKAMVPRTSLRGIELSATQTEANLTLRYVIDFITKNRVSRVPVFNTDKSMRYIIDDRTAFQVAAEKAAATPPIQPDAVPLATFLAHTIQDRSVKEIVTNFAVVSLDANLAEARDALAAKQGAHEVVVTKSGAANEPVEGWLTETDIAQSAEIK